MEKLTLAEILERFQNGEQRYDTNGYFKEAITAMLSGASPYMVLDRVLREHVILMHLHSEQVNKNRVAVAEVGRLATQVGEDDILIQRLEDEIKSYKDAFEGGHDLSEDFER